jgi:hypothetical protein
LRLQAPDHSRFGANQVIEKRFAFSGLTRKSSVSQINARQLSLPPLFSKESCINGRHASSAPRAAVSPN